MTKLVTRQQHRRTVGEHHGGDEVALLPFTQSHDLRVIGRSLDTMIPGVIVRMSVPVINRRKVETKAVDPHLVLPSSVANPPPFAERAGARD